GDASPIETRSAEEVLTTLGRDDYGQATRVALAPPGTRAINYGVDITPSRLLDGRDHHRGRARAAGHARDQLRVRHHAVAARDRADHRARHRARGRLARRDVSRSAAPA